MKFDMSRIYRERIEQIDKEILVCVKKKHWLKAESLRVEKRNLEQTIKKIECKSKKED